MFGGPLVIKSEAEFSFAENTAF